MVSGFHIRRRIAKGPILAKSDIDADRTDKRLTALVGSWALFYLSVCGLIPSLWIWHSYAEGKAYVQMYSHLFLFPTFFGWITVLLLIPFLRFIRTEGLFDRRGWKVFLSLPVVFALLSVVTVELPSKNHAPYELSPELIDNSPRLSGHFSRGEDIQLADALAFQDELGRLLDDPANWSVARLFHYSSVFLSASQMLLVFFSAGLLALYRLRNQSHRSESYRAALVACTCAVFVFLLWVLMRQVFLLDKTLYYGEVANVVKDYVVAALFFIGLLFLSTGLFLWLGEKLTAIIGLLGSAGGVFFVLSETDRLREVFGADATLAGYWTILLGIAAIGAAVYTPSLLLRNGKRGTNGPKDT